MAWISCLGASNAAEGISIAILCSIAAIRLPSTHALYPRLFRTKVMLVFLAVLAWRALSVAWTDNEAVGWSSGISRFVMVPLALWPMAHRFGALAVAGIVASSLISVALVAMNTSGDGALRYVDARTLGKEIGMTAACLVIGLLLTSLLSWGRRPAPILCRLAAVSAIAAGLNVMSQRSAFIAGAGGLLAGCTLAIPRLSRKQRLPTLLGFTAAIAVVITASVMSPRMAAWAGSLRSTVAEGELTRERWHGLTALRGPLAEISLEMARDRPILGYGMGGFEAECKRRCESKLQEEGDAARPFQSISGLVTSHNFMLDELCMRGGIGLALILALIFVLATRSIKDPESTACAAILAAWLLYGLTDATTGRGTYIAILALVVTRCAWIEALNWPAGHRSAAR